jgi:hypothetical protein
MRNLLKVLAMLTLLFAPVPEANAQVSFGITIGPPPRLRPSRVAPMPGPGYEWVDGYWYPAGSRWTWHAGYWTRPPFSGASWIQPYYDGRRYIPGYWDDGRGRFDHDHRWDHSKQRDDHRDRHDDHRDNDHDNRH